jgi:hypothetical protein
VLRKLFSRSVAEAADVEDQEKLQTETAPRVVDSEAYAVWIFMDQHVAQKRRSKCLGRELNI